MDLVLSAPGADLSSRVQKIFAQEDLSESQLALIASALAGMSTLDAHPSVNKEAFIVAWMQGLPSFKGNLPTYLEVMQEKYRQGMD